MISYERAGFALLAVIAFVLVTAALRASYEVTMPVAVAAVIIATIWPVKARLEGLIGGALANLVAICILLLVFAAFAAALYFTLAHAAQRLLEHRDRFEQLIGRVSTWAGKIGLEDVGQGAFEHMMQFVQPLLAGTYSALAYLGFIAVLVVLGLPAIGPTRNRIVAELEAGEKRELLDVVEEISSQIRDYVAITTLMSILTGAVTAGCAFAFGLDLAISWGLLNFLLNYVPLVGNIIGIIPPVLYALLQFDGWIRPVGLFAALAVLQLVISNFVYPMAQGRSLALPPVVILLALTFWSWIWGVAGALIALPLTVTAIIICRQFGSTRWIATLLSSESD